MAADYIRLNIKCFYSNGRQATHEVDVRPNRQLSLLKLYIKEFLGLDQGSLYLGQTCISADRSETGTHRRNETQTLSQLGIRTGRDTLQMRRTMRTPTQLQTCMVKNCSDEQHPLQVPVNCTVDFLKFIVECEEKIPMEHQCLECSHRLWDDKPDHRVTKEELAQLQISNSSATSCVQYSPSCAQYGPPLPSTILHFYSQKNVSDAESLNSEKSSSRDEIELPQQNSSGDKEELTPFPPNPRRLLQTAQQETKIPKDKDELAYISTLKKLLPK